jgi:Na+-transporting methylmalonyl-CoA/oxaloacetate decarboxylase gamma subunit
MSDTLSWFWDMYRVGFVIASIAWIIAAVYGVCMTIESKNDRTRRERMEYTGYVFLFLFVLPVYVLALPAVGLVALRYSRKQARAAEIKKQPIKSTELEKLERDAGLVPTRVSPSKRCNWCGETDDHFCAAIDQRVIVGNKSKTRDVYRHYSKGDDW